MEGASSRGFLGTPARPTLHAAGIRVKPNAPELSQSGSAEMRLWNERFMGEMLANP
jgi:hypothetical protein